MFRIGTQLACLGHERNLFAVRAFHHAFFGKRRGSVSDQDITLHFTNTQPAIIRTSFQRLMRQQRTRTRIALVDLVLDHLLQTHLKYRTHKDLCHDLLSGLTALQNLIPLRMESHLGHETGRIRNALADCEWCGIRQSSLRNTQLIASALQKLPHCHTSRDGVGIHDEIGTYTLGCEGKVLFGNNGTNCALLSMARRKLVSKSRGTTLSQPNANPQQSIRGAETIHSIHTTPLAALRHDTDIPIAFDGSLSVQLGGHKPNQHRLCVDFGTRLDNAIRIQLTVVGIGLPLDIRPLIDRQIGNLRVRLTTHIQDLLFLGLRMLVRGIKQATLQRALIHEHRVLLIEATLHKNGHHHILSLGHASKGLVLHPRLGQWAAGRTQNRRHGIKTFLEIGVVPPAGLLLLLSGREVVARACIVIRKGNDCRRRSQIVLGVNFADTLGMLRSHRDHQSIGLFCINPVEESFGGFPCLGSLQDIRRHPRTQYRPHRTTAIAPDGVGVIQAIPSQGNKSVNLSRPTLFQQDLVEALGVLRNDSHQIRIEKHSGPCGIPRRRMNVPDPYQEFGGVQHIHQFACRGRSGQAAKRGKRLDEPDRLAIGAVRRTHQTVLASVQPPRCGNIQSLVHLETNATQVGQGTVLRQPRQFLRNSILATPLSLK